MPSLPVSTRDKNTSSPADRELVRQFQVAWQTGRSTPRLVDAVEQISSESDTRRSTVLLELCTIDLEGRWARSGRDQQTTSATIVREDDPFGPCPMLEEYLIAYPELGSKAALPIAVILREYQARKRAGEEPTLAEIESRFPQQWPSFVPALKKNGKDFDKDATSGDSLKDTPNLGHSQQSTPRAATGTPIRETHSPRKPATPSAGSHRAAQSPAAGTFLPGASSEASSSGQFDKVDSEAGLRDTSPTDCPQNLARPASGTDPEATEPDSMTSVPPRNPTCTPTPSPRSGTPFGISSEDWHAPTLREFGNYEIIQEIAHGGMGVVYKARQRSLKRIVALKTILPDKLQNPEMRRRFLDEGENSARLNHENIVPIYDSGEVDGQYFFTMRFIDGESLDKLGRLEPRRAAEYIQTVAEAIHYAHHNSGGCILHRDLKPANIMLDHSGQLFVADFGISKRLDENSEATSSGGRIGTPGFMPPEQALGEQENIGKVSDVYSLGATLFALLTGEAPFVGSPDSVLIQVMTKEAPLARDKVPSVPADLEAICRKCLEKRRTDRYQSARELVEDLSRFLSDEPTHARPLTPLTRFAKWCRRSPMVAGLTLTVGVLLVGIATVTSLALADRSSALAEQKIANKKLEVAKGEAKDEANRATAAERTANSERVKAETEAEKATKAEAKANSERAKAEAAAEKAKIAEAKANSERMKAEVEAEKAKIAETAERTAKTEEKKQKDLAIQSQQRAESSLDVAAKAIREMLLKVADDRLKNIEGMDDLRKELARDTQDYIRGLQNVSGNNGNAKLKLIDVQTSRLNGELLALAGANQNQIENAYRQAITKAANQDNLQTDPAQRIQLTLEELSAQRDLANLFSQWNRQSAGDEFQNALKISMRADLMTINVSDPLLRVKILSEIALLHDSYAIFLVKAKVPDAAQAFEMAIEKFKDMEDARRLLPNTEEHLVLQKRHAHALQDYGGWFSRQANPQHEKAMDYIKQAIDIQATLLTDSEDRSLRQEHAYALTNLAAVQNVYINPDPKAVKPDESQQRRAKYQSECLKNGEKAVDEWRQLTSDFPAAMDYQHGYLHSLKILGEINQWTFYATKDKEFKEQANKRFSQAILRIDALLELFKSSTSTQHSLLTENRRKFQELQGQLQK